MPAARSGQAAHPEETDPPDARLKPAIEDQAARGTQSARR